MTQHLEEIKKYQCLKCKAFFTDEERDKEEDNRCPKCKVMFEQLPREAPHEVSDYILASKLQQSDKGEEWIPCTCPNGGMYEYVNGHTEVCDKCGGTEWVKKPKGEGEWRDKIKFVESDCGGDWLYFDGDNILDKKDLVEVIEKIISSSVSKALDKRNKEVEEAIGEDEKLIPFSGKNKWAIYSEKQGRNELRHKLKQKLNIKDTK